MFLKLLDGLVFFTPVLELNWLVHGQDLLVRLLINEQNPHVAEI